MKLKHHDLPIPEDDPFAHCKLGRKESATILAQVVDSYAEGFVLALNGEWGSGKTTFLRMWNQYLQNEGFKTIRFNAWESDFEKDVLVTLIAELQELADSKTQKSFKQVVGMAAPLAKRLVPGMTKQLIRKVAGEEVAGEAMEALLEFGSEELEAAMKSYAKRKESMQTFRQSLEEFIQKTSSDKPVVFIIDELDRCRPSYAVEVLEVIKHLFSVQGVVFVLSMDKEQLGHAVRGVYGSESINAEEYLRRFIDIEYAFPKTNTKGFCKYLYEHFGFDEFLGTERRLNSASLSGDRDQVLHFAPILFDATRASLRQQEKQLAYVRLVLACLGSNEYAFPACLLVLVHLKLFDPEAYRAIKKHLWTPQQMVDALDRKFPEVIREAERASIVRVIGLLAHFYNNDLDREQRISELVQKNSATHQISTNVHSQHDTNNDQGMGKILMGLSKIASLHNASLYAWMRHVDALEDFHGNQTDA